MTQGKTSPPIGPHFLPPWWLEATAGALLLLGIILAFFYPRIAAILVGLAFGLSFYKEIRQFYRYLKAIYLSHDLFKTLMWIGTVLFFLIHIPAFILGAVVGYLLLFTLHHRKK